MDTIDCIFVASGDHTFFEKIITDTTKSKYAHAATRLTVAGKRRIIHATRPSVHFSPGDKYDAEEIMEVITLPVSDEQMSVAVERSFALNGTRYGVDDCLISGVRDTLGDAVADVLVKFDQPDTIHCSATMVLILQAIWPDFAVEHQSCELTPEQVRLLVLDLKNKIAGGV